MGQNHRLTELAIVDLIGRAFQIGIDADRQSGKKLLIDANIKIIRPFRPHRTVFVDHRLLRRVVEQGKVGWHGLRLVGRREIARIAGMNACALNRLVDQRGARAELVRGNELIQLIEAQTRRFSQRLSRNPRAPFGSR